ncbi:MAG: hypothetical protein V4632_06855 [Pseudomonadota bacterium]
MSFPKWLAMAALASLPFAAAAQAQKQAPDPTDANVTIHAAAYDSAFRKYQPAGEQNETPDKVWRAANDEMQRLGGHAGHMKGAGDSKETAKPDHAPQHHRPDNKSKEKK